jgi:hypothetical protein
MYLHVGTCVGRKGEGGSGVVRGGRTGLLRGFSAVYHSTRELIQLGISFECMSNPKLEGSLRKLWRCSCLVLLLELFFFTFPFLFIFIHLFPNFSFLLHSIFSFFPAPLLSPFGCLHVFTPVYSAVSQNPGLSPWTVTS